MTTTLEAPRQAAPDPYESRLGPAVVISEVAKSYQSGRESVLALDHLSLTVAHGEFVCLLGASGCGKSTLLNLVAGLDTKTAGSIELHTTRPAVMFQEAALLPWLTAGRNVELPMRLERVSAAERKVRVAELLDLVHLSEARDKRPHELSGGMRQRVALARALATATRAGTDADLPGLLLMDEPFGALDAITRDVLQGELVRIWKATQTAILFVTHDVREAVRVAQRIVLLSSRPGRVVQEWQTAGRDPDDLAREITVRLREVISTHAAA